MGQEQGRLSNTVPLHKGVEKSGEIWRLRYHTVLFSEAVVFLGCAPLSSFFGLAPCNNHTHAVSPVRRGAAPLLSLSGDDNLRSSACRVHGPTVQVPFAVYKVLGPDLVIAFDIPTTLHYYYCTARPGIHSWHYQKTHQ